jgi:hypothetical protein
VMLPLLGTMNAPDRALRLSPGLQIMKISLQRFPKRKREDAPTLCCIGAANRRT